MKKKVIKAFWIIVEFYGKAFIVELEDGGVFFIGHPYMF